MISGKKTRPTSDEFVSYKPRQHNTSTSDENDISHRSPAQRMSNGKSNFRHQVLPVDLSVPATHLHKKSPDHLNPLNINDTQQKCAVNLTVPDPQNFYFNSSASSSANDVEPPLDLNMSVDFTSPRLRTSTMVSGAPLKSPQDRSTGSPISPIVSNLIYFNREKGMNKCF